MGKTFSTVIFTYADFWIQDQGVTRSDTGQLFDRRSLNAELEKIETGGDQ